MWFWLGLGFRLRCIKESKMNGSQCKALTKIEKHHCGCFFKRNTNRCLQDPPRVSAHSLSGDRTRGLEAQPQNREDALLQTCTSTASNSSFWYPGGAKGTFLKHLDRKFTQIISFMFFLDISVKVLEHFFLSRVPPLDVCAGGF